MYVAILLCLDLTQFFLNVHILNTKKLNITMLKPILLLPYFLTFSFDYWHTYILFITINIFKFPHNFEIKETF